jgi:hypothetical protein
MKMARIKTLPFFLQVGERPTWLKIRGHLLFKKMKIHFK